MTLTALVVILFILAVLAAILDLIPGSSSRLICAIIAACLGGWLFVLLH